MLRKVKELFEREDSRALRRLAKQLALEAGKRYSKDIADIAVLSYVLSKILSKVHIITSPEWPQVKSVILDMFDNVFDVLDEVERDYGNFVKSLEEKGRSKLASELYAAGFSLKTVTELFDADPHDVMDYIGHTKIHDEEEVPSIRERVIGLRRLLG